MEKNTRKLTGIFFVSLGAIFYGMNGIFIKLAYKQNYTVTEIMAAQFSIAILVLFIINLLTIDTAAKIKLPDKRRLILAGSSLGFTNLFYSSAIQYIDVSIVAVLLMQSVWISILIESLVQRKFPSGTKLIATALILTGTVLATDLLNQEINLNLKGLLLGFLSACSFTVTMFTSNRIANYLPSYKKGMYMLYGGGIIVFIFCIFNQMGFSDPGNIFDVQNGDTFYLSSILVNFNFSTFYTWGIPLALFGSILAPIFSNKGFPDTGLGLGGILSSLELPASVIMAVMVLHEKISFIQWIGIALILFAVILSNINKQLGFNK